MKRLSARARALPGLIAEANRRLAAIEACTEGDWSTIGEAASYLAQHLHVGDFTPDWERYPLGTRRYARLGFTTGRDASVLKNEPRNEPT